MPFDKATVKDAPKVDPDGRLSEREEQELYRHYGMDYGSAGSGSGTDARRCATTTPSAATPAARRPTTP